ncbi:MAG: N-6 DNA methylase, partial [Pontiella sp.]
IGENGEPNDIEKIISTYMNRPPEEERYCRRVGMDEIVENDYNLNITRYVSTAKPEPIIDLGKTHKTITAAEKDIRTMTAKHNEFLNQLGLPPLPGS